MIKHFCDGCREEISDDNKCTGGAINSHTGRLGTELKRNGKTLRVEVLTGTDGTSNAGDWCKYCVLDALYRMDDRPKPKR